MVGFLITFYTFLTSQIAVWNSNRSFLWGFFTSFPILFCKITICNNEHGLLIKEILVGCRICCSWRTFKWKRWYTFLCRHKKHTIGKLISKNVFEEVVRSLWTLDIAVTVNRISGNLPAFILTSVFIYCQQRGILPFREIYVSTLLGLKQNHKIYWDVSFWTQL